MLLTVFLPGDSSLKVSNIREQVAALQLGQITKMDMRNLMINPFMEQFEGLVTYMLQEVVSDVTNKPGLSEADEVVPLVEEVASRCLEISCKVRPENIRFRQVLINALQGSHASEAM